ncbi:MAG: ABC-2 family transporter protein [Candidatus Blackburnbacteria bacterium]|nr:ABC-2 family transporter protein [Candidatus Blackburnbacteria bacterium]
MGKKLNNITRYLEVLKVAWEDNLVYRTNLVLWRLRSIMGLLILYFLWSTVFLGTDKVFGYDRASILTYVLGTSFVRSLVLSSTSSDVAGEIHNGRLTNFLLKPFSYLGYWFTRDLADKILGLLFSVLEISIIVWVFKPPIILQRDPEIWLAFSVTTILALVLFFYLSFLISLMAFWIREIWGLRFLTMTSLEFLSGGMFPLDILPLGLFSLLKFLPFTYLIFFPLKVYLGQISGPEILQGVGILLLWIAIIYFAVKLLWARGLRVYAGEGR